MKSQTLSVPGLAVCLILLLLGSHPSAGWAAQTTPATPTAAVTGGAAPVAVAPDSLVVVKNHYMWKSKIGQMHPELVQKAQAPSKVDGTDFLVNVGKRSVYVSTLRRLQGPHTTRPASHGMACTDYLVQSGKRAVWASSIGAPCPAGPHKGKMKPLCCVAALETGKDIKPCCRAAQGD